VRDEMPGVACSGLWENAGQVPRFSERCVITECERIGDIVDEAGHYLRRSLANASDFDI